MESGACRAFAASLVITELRVVPLRAGRADLAAEYRRLFESFPNLELVPLGNGVCERAADLRARYGLRTPDALHVAAALEAGADAFVTGDQRLLAVRDIEILPLVARGPG